MEEQKYDSRSFAGKDKDTGNGGGDGQSTAGSDSGSGSGSGSGGLENKRPENERRNSDAGGKTPAWWMTSGK